MISLAVITGLFSARVMTSMSPYLGHGLSGISEGISVASSTIPAEPFAIDWLNHDVLMAFVIPFFTIIILILLQSRRAMKLSNEDTEAAHGDARLATEQEMKSLKDARIPCNNRFYSETVAMPVVGWNKETLKSLRQRNANSIVTGTSGSGKSFGSSYADHYAAIGSAIAPGRAKSFKELKVLNKGIPRPANFAHVGAKNIDAYIGWEKVQTRKYLQYLTSNYKGLPKGFAEGYDVFATDPKGDTVRSLGWMYECAGYDIKIFDTVGFKGAKYNPFARIATRFTDATEPRKIKIQTKFEGATEAGQFSESKELKGAKHSFNLRPSSSLPQVEYTNKTPTAIFDLSLSTDVLTYENIEDQSRTTWLEVQEDGSIKEATKPKMGGWMTEEIQIKKKVDEKTGLEYEQEELVHVHHDGTGCPKMMDAIKSFTYNRTSGTLNISVNLPAGMSSCDVKFTLDPCLELDDLYAPTGDFIWPKDQDGDDTQKGEITWHINKSSQEEHQRFELSAKVHIVPIRVPDSVALTKVVNTLVANLGSKTDKLSNGSQDPFWEDTKRLDFIAHIAYLFERFEDPSQHTLPQMMKLMEHTLADTGNPADTSAMDLLMDEWEYGRTWVETDNTATQGRRGSVRGGTWQPTDFPPHPRSTSLAVHCYRAVKQAAPETVQSIVISVNTALVNLLSEDVQEMLSSDEMQLHTLGDPNQKQVIFAVTQDTNSPYDFLTALLVDETIDVLMEKAALKYNGRLPRHVRFILDEVANIGSLPSLVRAIAVVRSRNVSMALYVQSRKQLELVYGKEQSDIIFDNVSTRILLATNDADTQKEFSDMSGEETVFQRVYNLSGQSDSMQTSRSESITSTARKVKTQQAIANMSPDELLILISGMYLIQDQKFKTEHSPYYAYSNPLSAHEYQEQIFVEPWVYKDYRLRRRNRELKAKALRERYMSKSN